MGNVDQDEVEGLSPGTLIDGRYKIVRFIGRGGNGLVHEVEHVLTGRRLALKSLLDESGYGRLEQEARAASLMKNPHAVKITDMGTTPARGPYIVMELLEGQSLRGLLEETGQLPLELTVNIALQVCECLAEAHTNGIIHRDLKPDNVFLVPGQNPGQYDVKVLDFGVVKIASDGPIPNSSLTRTGSTVGTPFYMSLEQLRNSSNVDARSDLYALAVVLYESLSGSKPFQAETIGDLVYALCSGPPTHLSRLRPDLPPDVCEVIMRGLSMNREQRQSSMLELATQLMAHGDPTLGQWMTAPPKRASTASIQTPRPGPGAPKTPAHTPSGVKPGLASPISDAPSEGTATALNPSQMQAPLAPRTPLPPRPMQAPRPPQPAVRHQQSPAPPTVELDPSHGSDRRQENLPVDHDRRSGEDRRQHEREVQQERRAPRPPPQFERSGDRDTPTEMYVKGVHGVELPPPAVVTADRDTPTSHIEPITFTGTGPTTPMPNTGRSAARSSADDPFPPFNPLSASATPDSTAALSPQHGQPQGQLGAGFQPGSMASASYPAQMAPRTAAKPAWQRKIDDKLSGFGRFIENSGQRLVMGFRSATPRQQIIIVICGASLVAILIVLTLYLFIG